VFEVPDHFECVEGLHLGPVVSWLEVAIDDHDPDDGNLIVVSELEVPSLPSIAVPTIMQARRAQPGEGAIFAGPLDLLGPIRRKIGDPLGLRTEFAMLGLSLAEANENRAAGFVRIRELLRPDPDRLFPGWYEKRVGEKDSSRLFIDRERCPRLVEQLASAPLEEDDEPYPRSAVSRRWEVAGGGLVAALRYAVLSRPAPPAKPEPEPEDPRARHLRDVVARDRELDELVDEGHLEPWQAEQPWRSDYHPPD
jgi:hypothetical protein